VTDYNRAVSEQARRLNGVQPEYAWIANATRLA